MFWDLSEAGIHAMTKSFICSFPKDFLSSK